MGLKACSVSLEFGSMGLEDYSVGLKACSVGMEYDNNSRVKSQLAFGRVRGRMLGIGNLRASHAVMSLGCLGLL